MPSIIKLDAVKKAKATWSSWMWVKMISSPTNVGVIGKPVKPRQDSKNTKANFGWSYECPLNWFKSTRASIDFSLLIVKYPIIHSFY